MINTFLIQLTQYEKTGSIGKFFIPLRKLKKIPPSKLEIDHVFRASTILLFDTRVCLPLNNENEVNLKTAKKFI